jgi:imidazolonepropionase-like amidohydrolase
MLSGGVDTRRIAMNNRVRIGIVGLCLIAAVSAHSLAQEKAPEPVIALVGATLIDGTGAPPLADATVLIRGQRIEAVGPATAINVPPGAQSIDLSGRWILPGFIDCHIHTGGAHDDVQELTDTDSLVALRSVHTLDLYLRSGVTAVRDVGSPVESMQAVLAAQKAGYLDTIRLFACGNLITVTGGHGDGLRGVLAVDGPWAWRKAVREMYKAGFGHIKISPTFTPEEASAAVDEARTLGIRITAHGGGFSDTTPTTMTRVAVEAGVQCIEHLNEMEDDVLDLIARKGVYVVPTLSAYREVYRANTIPPVLVEKRHWTLSMHETLFRKARQRGIVMGIGTDGVGEMAKLYPGLYFTEMKYFVELGASPIDAIVAATRNGAMILGKADELGTIEPGKLADLQVVAGDPLESFDVLGKPELVSVGGTVHRF